MRHHTEFIYRQSGGNSYAEYLLMWRREAFEHTLTFRDFESYLVANLDKMIRRTRVLELVQDVARQESVVNKSKLVVMTEDNRRWWINQKVAAITEARRQQEEEQAEAD